MDEEQNQEDLKLMKRIALGDEDAFRLLMEKHQPAVIGTIARMTNHSADTEDLAQQVFFRLWKSAKRYEATAKFTTFLFTITRNLVFNASRKKSRSKEFSYETADGERPIQFEDPNPHSQPDRALADQELQKIIDQAIAQLPESQRLAVVLRRYEELPYEEIAEVLNLTVPAVKSQLFRARTTLRQALQGYLDS